MRWLFHGMMRNFNNRVSDIGYGEPHKPNKDFNASYSESEDMKKQIEEKRRVVMDEVKENRSSIQYKDPVCGMWISEENAQAKANFNGKDFYFCSLECAQKFNSSPENFTNINHVSDQHHDMHQEKQHEQTHESDMERKGKMNHSMGHGGHRCGC